MVLGVRYKYEFLGLIRTRLSTNPAAVRREVILRSSWHLSHGEGNLREGRAMACCERSLMRVKILALPRLQRGEQNDRTTLQYCTVLYRSEKMVSCD
jgi:hypothetical protein